MPIRGKTSKGKLVDKYKNRKRLLNTQHFTVPRKIRKTNSKGDHVVCQSETNGPLIQQQLVNARDLPWSEVKDLWKDSVNYRKNQIIKDDCQNASMIIRNWPCFKHPSGHNLVRLPIYFHFVVHIFVQIMYLVCVYRFQ